MRRLDDEVLLVVRQRPDAPPHSEPAGHTGHVGSWRNRRTHGSLSTYGSVQDLRELGPRWKRGTGWSFTSGASCTISQHDG